VTASSPPPPPPSGPLDIARAFASVPDPRHPKFPGLHRFEDVLLVALCAVLSGAESWEAVVQFGRPREGWLRSLGLRLPGGIPSHDTLGRIFAALDPAPFRDCFTAWIAGVCDDLGVTHVPIDGKALRGTRGPDGTCLRVVSAWSAEHGLTLAQLAVPEGSNETAAIPDLLRLPDLKGALVSIDAAGCDKAVAEQIRGAGADYLLSLKANQPTLHADVEAAFAHAEATGFAGLSFDRFATQETGHGRSEGREYTVLYDPEGLSTAGEWADLASAVRVVRKRGLGDKATTEVAYYISSSRASARKMGGRIRNHWSIENGCHWVLDVVFGEDCCRTRAGHAAEDLAWLRKVTLTLLKEDDSGGSLKGKYYRAALDDAYRLQLLASIRENKVA
jgi:predicted transposase YbfD/YdcC